MTKSSKKAAASTKSASSTPAAKSVPKAAAQETVSAAAVTKVGKTELIDMIATNASLSKKDAGAAFTSALDVIAKTLKSGQTVSLPGIGTLSVKATAARTGVRPGTSEKIQIAAGKKVSFKVATDLKKSL